MISSHYVQVPFEAQTTLASGNPLAASIYQREHATLQGCDKGTGLLHSPSAAEEKPKATLSQGKGKSFKRLLPILLAAALVPTAILGFLKLRLTSRPRKHSAGNDQTKAAAVRQTNPDDLDQNDMLPLSGNSTVESHFHRSH
eukprot:GHVT01025069.1.p1 GENE.GHVT01025069.1~~GHVT01025069.1.p1  ORF type:complete len:142 (+),score=22.33 GHVT01025069.1:1249-1674(+)